MLYLHTFLSVATSWAFVGLLTHLGKRASALNGLVAGVICGLLSYLLPLAGIFLDPSLPALLVLAAILPLQGKVPLARRILSLLLSVSCWATLSFCFLSLQTVCSPAADAVLALLLSGAFLLGGWKLEPIFPTDDWAGGEEKGTEERIPIRVASLWIAPGLVTIAELMARFAVGAASGAGQAAGLCLGYLLLFWGGLFGFCLMAAYRQQRLTTLVDQDYRNEMQSFMSVIRSQRHDYNFHVQALAGLIQEGNLEECQKYVTNLVQDSIQMNTILPVKDPAIGALIFSFRTMAEENGIELHMDIQNDLSAVVTSVYETNKVIGNLLQNAIDEVKTHKDKSFGIYLYILKRGENCIIHVANKVRPKADPNAYLEDIYQPGHTTKDGHEGIGLNSIQNLLRRYRGVLYSRMEDDIIHFFAKIPMELQGEQT